MTKEEIKEIIECINLLKIDGRDTKQQVQEKLIKFVKDYEED